MPAGPAGERGHHRFGDVLGAGGGRQHPQPCGRGRGRHLPARAVGQPHQVAGTRRQRPAPGRQRDAGARPAEQRIAQVRAQRGHGGGHRRLAHAERLRGRAQRAELGHEGEGAELGERQARPHNRSLRTMLTVMRVTDKVQSARPQRRGRVEGVSPCRYRPRSTTSVRPASPTSSNSSNTTVRGPRDRRRAQPAADDEAAAGPARVADRHQRHAPNCGTSPSTVTGCAWAR